MMQFKCVGVINPYKEEDKGFFQEDFYNIQNPDGQPYIYFGLIKSKTFFATEYRLAVWHDTRKEWGLLNRNVSDWIGTAWKEKTTCLNNVILLFNRNASLNSKRNIQHYINISAAQQMLVYNFLHYAPSLSRWNVDYMSQEARRVYYNQITNSSYMGGTVVDYMSQEARRGYREQAVNSSYMGGTMISSIVKSKFFDGESIGFTVYLGPIPTPVRFFGWREDCTGRTFLKQKSNDEKFRFIIKGRCMQSIEDVFPVLDSINRLGGLDAN